MATALRLVFAGTPEFALPTLRALCDSHHAVCAVYTQPDRPAGRGRRLRASPVKTYALEQGLAVEQPATLNLETAQQTLADYRPDVLIVVAYGLLLPRAVLALPMHGCLNVHASRLPRWRGAAPIQRALLAGDTETGVTIMQMDEGLDTGPVLARRSCPIGPEDTGGLLHDRLAQQGALLLLDVLGQLVAGTLDPSAQDPSQACYASKVRKADGILDWRRPAAELERQVRAFNPWPVAQTRLPDGQTLRVWAATAVAAGPGGAPGTVIAAQPEGIDVATGHGTLRLREIQLPGGRRLTPGEFLAARRLAGSRFG
ncbi:MAG: methionyl-tRNA formyltransferase [Chromatiales bacterium 21-64-14]|nr:MAG: methionyl-tRNA formyltransferase [Chromatiales bacterium 21-64-14]HQU14485.1 methionyl-tRNA formyltransferase [Gammaproteobacteria bacterium]